MNETEWQYRLGAGTRVLIGVLVGVSLLAIVAAAACAVGWAYTYAKMFH